MRLLRHPLMWPVYAIVLALLGIIVVGNLRLLPFASGRGILPPSGASMPATAAPRPVQVAATPTPVLAPPIATPGFISGGLGLSRSAWEAAHGRPGREDAGFVSYEGGKFVVSFRDGRVWRIERVWGDRAPVSADAAQAEGRSLIPSDAALSQRYTASGGRTVDLYRSASLPAQMPTATWTGGEPGDLIVIPRVRDDGTVTSIVVATGNNP